MSMEKIRAIKPIKTELSAVEMVGETGRGRDDRFSELRQEYDWKKRLREDVNSVRAEVQRRGGIKAELIDDAIKRYRKSIAGD
uniref:Uncharacterized protein n=1 Tax=Candidatus Kentrum sp. FW TaxID=2126338 RepID=A0A450RVS5_9GAMM|nr:MAG: hypothetical protein BECKFW1821A_GA0114235_100323 [Candidatus Kentron sp. FW]VFJ60405.1 MAG: hypothetical protein BECKFW1821B_GA0114236_105615 [Candidatus Kentron sp. FW]